MAESTPVPRAAAALSGHLDTRTAGQEVADRLFDGVGAGCDLVIAFASFHHRAAMTDAMDTIRRTLAPKVALAATAESVLGGEHEREGLAGFAAVAVSAPGLTVRGWYTTPDDPMPLRDPYAMAERLRVDERTTGVLMIGDPFSTPVTRLLPAMDTCLKGIPVAGGFASGASQPAQNVLIVDDRASAAGVIGVTIGGDVEMSCIVSQGCRPVGRTFVITKAHENLVLELGGRPAMDVLREMGEGLSGAEKQLLAKGLLIGHVIDERKSRFGRGDFLVRSVLGMDQKRSAVAIGEMARVGQTVQFHVRDAVTAAEDLQLLLDAQQLEKPPFAGLLFTCNGRGKRLFEVPDHDLSVIRERLGAPPIAGLFAAGEIGPIGGHTYLHGHTASLALLRAR
jgi:small ligand-binding sensory domain FIST